MTNEGEIEEEIRKGVGEGDYFKIYVYFCFNEPEWSQTYNVSYKSSALMLCNSNDL